MDWYIAIYNGLGESYDQEKHILGYDLPGRGAWIGAYNGLTTLSH